MTHSHLKGASATSGSASATIGFRLDEQSRRVLLARAAALKVSPHELARDYVLTVLMEADERNAWTEALTGLHNELAALRQALVEKEEERAAWRQAVVDLHNQHLAQSENFALAVEALLSSAGRVVKAEARAWVKENFR